jgi:hypothetical protein
MNPPISLLALAAMSCPHALATTHRQLEDFTSQHGCDTLMTTALWDTAAGELRLPLGYGLAGNFETPGAVLDAAVAGDVAYLAVGSAGLVVIDITEPANPALMGGTSAPGDARAVAIAGDRAYVADGSSGLRVINISDAANPLPIAVCDTPGWATVSSVRHEARPFCSVKAR